MPPVEVSRICLANKAGRPRKFVNIVAIYKEGKFFEFKITFEGIEKTVPWMFVEGGVTDVNRGLRSFQRKTDVTGAVSIGYHADGNVMYKSGGGNSKPIKHYPVASIPKVTHFLRLFGFSLSDLEPAGQSNKANTSVLVLENYSDKTRVACDIYISRGQGGVNFAPEDPKTFRNSKSISLYEEREDVGFHLHFYRTDATAFHVMVMKKGWRARLASLLRYTWLQWKDGREKGTNPPPQSPPPVPPR